MRKVTFLLLLKICVFQNFSNAQVSITYAADSTGGICPDSSYATGFYMFAETFGYTNTDYPIIYVDFGDGTDTTWVDSSFFSNFPETGAVISHDYLNNGTYDVTFIVTMPDFQADTMIINFSLGLCESISGYALPCRSTAPEKYSD